MKGLIKSMMVYSEEKNKRIEWIDIFKGIGIILMIVGHIGYGNTARKIIYSFHMPMFFFISGYLFNEEKIKLNFKEFIKPKIKHLIIPYIVFGIIYYILGSILYGFDYKSLIALLCFNHDNLMIETALWFLTSIFWVELFNYILRKYLYKGKHIIIIIIFLIGIFETDLFRVKLPFSIGSAFIGLFIYTTGYICKIKLNFIVNFGIARSLVVLIIGIYFSMNNGIVNMRLGVYNNVLYFYIAAISFIIFVANICNYISNNRFLSNISLTKYVKNIGKNSIIYLCLNHIAIKIATQILSIFSLPQVVSKVLILTISLITIYWLGTLIMSSKLKSIVGK